MRKSTPTPSQTITLIPEIYSVDDSYSIEEVVRITHVPRFQIAVYCRYGFISTLSEPQRDGWRFDPSSIAALQRIRHLKRTYQLNTAAVKLVCSLMNEIDHLRDEVGKQPSE
ncbi:chaperone modulator CbpM [Pelagicoccus enzymogenes]|uniref:chaperone modulator CbpM n=1 Tax=Pelagicoccus enzymogenes TaxID=2773457 RepID=UPI00280CD6F3|nr:chaperone modulator CbpM [Pelagicoccus enzymogenes]MDQ8198432.1 chaperone modulator CbpM [Pelagicoccus enzymogenes]